MSLIVWFFALSGLFYIFNIFQIIFGQSRTGYTAVFKVLGIFIFPLGVLMGFFGMFS